VQGRWLLALGAVVPVVLLHGAYVVYGARAIVPAMAVWFSAGCVAIAAAVFWWVGWDRLLWLVVGIVLVLGTLAAAMDNGVSRRGQAVQ
jgi:hypothetical protein